MNDLVVRFINRIWIFSVDRILGRVEINSNVNAGVGKELHACVMIGSVVYRVHSDGVYTQFLELLYVSLAGRLFSQWIGELRITAWLNIESSDIKSFVASEKG